MQDDPPGNGFAVSTSPARSCAGVRPGATDSIRLATPLTIGAAKLVPLTPVTEYVPADCGRRFDSTAISRCRRCSPPGAATSTVAPEFE